MHKRYFLLVILIAVCLATCTLLSNTIWIKVIAEDGAPITGAQVRFSWTVNEPWGPNFRSGDPRHKEASSDKNGLVSASINEDHYVSVEAIAPGFYPGVLDIVDGALRAHGKASDCLLFSLKRIVDPQHLVGKKANVILPGRNGEAGYDFLLGDLVAPHGRGQHEDIIFRWSYEPNHGGYKQRTLWDFRFPEKDSGIQTARLSKDQAAPSSRSDLISEHTAPPTGYFSSFRQAENEAGLGERGAWGGAIYYFATRRPDGMIYGKILGEPEIIFFDPGETVIKFTYVMNPSHSRSLDPDMKNVSFPKQNDWETPYTLPESYY